MVPVWRKWAIKIRPTTYTISRVSKYQQTVMMSPLFHFFKSMPRRSKIKIIIETFNFIEETNLELWWIYFTHSMPKMFQMFMSLKIGTLTSGNQYHIFWNKYVVVHITLKCRFCCCMTEWHVRCWSAGFSCWCQFNPAGVLAACLNMQDICLHIRVAMKILWGFWERTM